MMNQIKGSAHPHIIHCCAPQTQPYFHPSFKEVEKYLSDGKQLQPQLVCGSSGI